MSSQMNHSALSLGMVFSACECSLTLRLFHMQEWSSDEADLT